MSPTAEELLKQALTLDEKDRASVAGALIESLHQEADPDAEVAGMWRSDAASRNWNREPLRRFLGQR